MVRKILIPTDFSISAQHALLYTLDLNSLLKARLYLLHVLQEFTDFSEFNLCPSILPQLYAEFEQHASRRLEEIVSTVIPPEVTCSVYLLHGVPFHEIVQFASNEEIDLIAIGTRGRTGIQSVIFGSTAEKVIKRAPCPVLSIRHPQTEPRS